MIINFLIIIQGKMKSLIIGGAGFVGSYLIQELKKTNEKIFVTKMPQESIMETGIDIINLNILEPEKIIKILKTVQPDCIYHLAAQSSVSVSWEKPDLTVDVNIKGVINVLEAVKFAVPKARVLLIGSGEEYGHVKENEIPIQEETVLRPGNIYAATKSCQNMIGKIYSDAYDLDILMVRAFNHIGPNQAPLFVVSDFCKQVAEIEAGKREPCIYVGNLTVKRDFTDVRDVVRAYVLLMKNGEKGETYNVGSGHAIAIEDILHMILSESTKDIQIVVDKKKFRPVDVPIIEADIMKLKKCTEWKKWIPLSITIKETLQYWRSKQ